MTLATHYCSPETAARRRQGDEMSGARGESRRTGTEGQAQRDRDRGTEDRERGTGTGTE